MKMDYNFSRGAWTMDGLTPAYTLRFPATPDFIQRDDCIENPKEPTSADGYSYISLVTEKKLTPDVKISTRCSFEGLAAPLIVLPRELHRQDGRLRYGDYLEIVAWKHGINVWKLWKEPDGTVKYHKLLGFETALSEGVIHDFSVEIKKQHFVIALDEHKMTLRCEDIYPDFHLGITGCEGVCKFYDMQIEA